MQSFHFYPRRKGEAGLRIALYNESSGEQNALSGQPLMENANAL